MDYSVNDVVIWIVIFIVIYALFRCVLRVRDWWKERIGYDPIERAGKRSGKNLSPSISLNCILRNHFHSVMTFRTLCFDRFARSS
jgi:biopolymer transport protein ExbB/TolQ